MNRPLKLIVQIGTKNQSNEVIKDEAAVPAIMNLSEDVFEPSMSAVSGLFSFLSGIFAQIFRQIVSMIRKRLRNTNLVTSIYFKMKKTSLPVDVLRSKTPFLKFPSNTPPLTVYYKRHHCLQTLFVIFTFVRGEIKKLFQEPMCFWLAH